MDKIMDNVAQTSSIESFFIHYFFFNIRTFFVKEIMLRGASLAFFFELSCTFAVKKMPHEFREIYCIFILIKKNLINTKLTFIVGDSRSTLKL